MKIINIILLIGAIQGFLLTILIYLKKDIIFHKLLSLIILIISSALLLAYFQNIEDLTKYPFLIKTNNLFPLIFIPLLLVYLKKITGSFTEGKSKHFILFIPFFVVLLYNLPFYLSDLNIKLDVYRNEMNFTPTINQIIEDIFIELSITVFGLLAISDVKLYKQRVDNIFSNHEKAKIHWLKFIAYSMFLLSLFALIVAIAQLFVSEIPNFIQFVTAIASTIIIYYIAYFLLSHPQVLVEVSEKINTYIAKKESQDKAINGNNKEKNIHSDFEKKLIKLLEVDKIYTKPEITIDGIAERIGIPTYLTSKIINQKLNTNFYTLINKYRLEEVKFELLNSKDKTIIEIAYQAGFNSKTTFYDVFKKNTGLSPSEFKKQEESDTKSE